MSSKCTGDDREGSRKIRENRRRPRRTGTASSTVSAITIRVEPKFLGMLRERLSEETSQMIFEEINEDLSALDAREIQAQLRRR